MPSETGSPDITIVICTFNRAGHLRRALGDLVSQSTTAVFEVVVVDDASTDRTREVIKEFEDSAPVPVRGVESIGSSLAAARNRGIAEARGRWIAFIDDDQRAPEFWLDELWTVATRVGAEFVGGPIDLVLPSSTEIGPTIRAIYGEYPPTRGRRSDPPLPPGGNRMISIDVFDRVGLHDESILTGGEDADFLRRSVAEGVRFAWASEANVKHIITPDRLRVSELHSYCRASGASLAQAAARSGGRRGLIVGSIVRVARGWIANGVVMVMSLLSASTVARRDCQARFWLTSGFLTEAARVLADDERETLAFRELRL